MDDVFCVTDEYGRPIGFYRTEIHGEEIPSEAFPIDEKSYRFCMQNNGRCKLEGGEFVLCEQRESTAQEFDFAGSVRANVVLSKTVDVLCELSGSNRSHFDKLLSEKGDS